MSENTQLLDFIYKNAKMGETTLPLVIGMVSRPDLRTALSSQLVEYCSICDEAKNVMRRYGVKPQEPGEMQSAAAETMLHLNTLAGHAPSKIAKMMIRGSTMGTVQMTKRIHEYQYTADPEALQLANRLLATEESNIEQMKQFL